MSSWLHPKGETKTSQHPTAPPAQRRLPAYSGSPWENNLLCGARMKKTRMKKEKQRAEGSPKVGHQNLPRPGLWEWKRSRTPPCRRALSAVPVWSLRTPGRRRRFTQVQGGGRQPSRGRLTLPERVCRPPAGTTSKLWRLLVGPRLNPS